jgi:hypothetical protein
VLAVDPGRIETVRVITEMAADGYSLRSIADALNGGGVPAARGPWHANSVRWVLKNSGLMPAAVVVSVITTMGPRHLVETRGTW